MKRGAVTSVVVAVIATAGLGFVFLQNSSPYLTIKEVDPGRKDIHVSGTVVPGTIQQNVMAGEVRFTLQDETGQMPVVYSGPPLANLSTATKVVAIGTKKGTEFHSEKMLVKCPSKYESEQAQTPK